MTDKQKIDRALGATPEGFSRRMEQALSACGEKKPVRFIPLRTAVIGMAALLLLCSAALAATMTYGFDWWLNNRWTFIRQHQPELYAQIEQNVQHDVPQSATRNALTVVAEDVAWTDETALFSFRITNNDSRYELHPLHHMDVDGACVSEEDLLVSTDPTERSEHWLWTEKGFGPPETVMDDPTRTLLLFSGENVRINTYNGPPLLGAWDVVRTENGDILVMIQYSAENNSPDSALPALIDSNTDADGYLTLYYPYTTRVFANGEYGEYVDAGVLSFRVKVK